MARESRTSRVSLWRWSGRYAAGGVAAITPKGKGPKPRTAVTLALQPQILSRVQRFAVLRGSAAAGWRALVADGTCPVELRSLLAPGVEIPRALISAVGFTRRCARVRVSIRRAGIYTHTVQFNRSHAA